MPGTFAAASFLPPRQVKASESTRLHSPSNPSRPALPQLHLPQEAWSPATEGVRLSDAPAMRRRNRDGAVALACVAAATLLLTAPSAVLGEVSQADVAEAAGMAADKMMGGAVATPEQMEGGKGDMKFGADSEQVQKMNFELQQLMMDKVSLTPAVSSPLAPRGLSSVHLARHLPFDGRRRHVDGVPCDGDSLTSQSGPFLLCATRPRRTDQ